MEKRGERSFLTDSLCVYVCFYYLSYLWSCRNVLYWFSQYWTGLRVLKYLPVILSSICAIYMMLPKIRYALSVLKYPSYNNANLTHHCFVMHWELNIILVWVTKAQPGSSLSVFQGSTPLRYSWAWRNRSFILLGERVYFQKN